MNEEGTYIRFQPTNVPPEYKTKRWFVVSKSTNAVVGRISWFPSWRKYGFFPKEETVFEEICLREIANFCEQKTKVHKEQHEKETHAGTTGVAG